MSFSTLLFDLDDTLYPADSGVWKAIRQRIDLYVAQEFDLPLEDARNRRQDLFLRYGTTMRGLQAECHIDEDEYLAFVHDVPLADFIQPDPVLKEVLSRYSQQKIIFTNADVHHARRVIGVLGLEGLFDQIIDIKAVAPYCKPMPEAFHIALSRSGEGRFSRCVLVDDQISTVRAAVSLGMTAIRVGPSDPQVSLSIPRLSDLPQVLPVDGFIFH